MTDKELIEQLRKIAQKVEHSHPDVSIILFATCGAIEAHLLGELGSLVWQWAALKKAQLIHFQNWLKSKRN